VAKYNLVIKKSAVAEIEEIEPKKVRQQIVERIGDLAYEPRPPGCEKLAGGETGYRVRQGVYRIVYTVEDGLLIVEVVKVAHRREVYR
jgi:mRNA interferase RelE/StbE